MTRVYQFFCVVLAGISLCLYLENREVRADQLALRYAYGSFLAKKVSGTPLSSLVKLDSLAVFRVNGAMLGCAQFR